MASAEELRAKIDKARQDREAAEAKTRADLAAADEAVMIALLEDELERVSADPIGSMSDAVVLPGRDEKPVRVTPPLPPTAENAGGNK